MAFYSQKTTNPELDVIRNSVEGPPNIEEAVYDLIHKTNRIHISFLFEKEDGRKALSLMCLSLTSTEKSPLYSNWEDLGSHLGLNCDLIKIFRYGYDQNDPTYNVFRAYAQENDATIGKVLETLKKINRPDVITKTYNLLRDLAEEVIRSCGNSEESGYLSISGGNAESSNECSEDGIQQTIIRSVYVPSFPDIYKKNVQVTPEANQPLNPPRCLVNEEEKFQRASPNNSMRVSSNPKCNYGLKVLLTYASDGIEDAKEVAKVMRKERDGLPRIGVLILQEQMEYVNRDPNLFVSGAFHQVDYIIPIITEKYLKSATAVNPSVDSNIDCIDANYVRYIYSLMNTYFVKNGCMNNKFRCIIPDKILQTVIRHPLMTVPLFQVWVKTSETESLSRRLLQAKRRKT